MFCNAATAVHDRGHGHGHGFEFLTLPVTQQTAPSTSNCEFCSKYYRVATYDVTQEMELN